MMASGVQVYNTTQKIMLSSIFSDASVIPKGLGSITSASDNISHRLVVEADGDDMLYNINRLNFRFAPFSMFSSFLLCMRIAEFNLVEESDLAYEYLKVSTNSSLGFLAEAYVGSSRLLEDKLASNRNGVRSLVDALLAAYRGVEDASTLKSCVKNWSGEWKMKKLVESGPVLVPGEEYRTITPNMHASICGTTTALAAYDAVITTASTFYDKSSNNRRLCEYVSCEYSSIWCIDGFILLRELASDPVYVIPVQATTASDMDLNDAPEWVKNFREHLRTSALGKELQFELVVSAFCVLIPRVRGSSQAATTTIKAENGLIDDDTPYVAAEFDVLGASKDIKQCIHVFQLYYWISVQLAMNSSVGEPVSSSHGYYPSTSFW
jgi:hypothetical protein